MKSCRYKFDEREGIEKTLVYNYIDMYFFSESKIMSIRLPSIYIAETIYVSLHIKQKGVVGNIITNKVKVSELESHILFFKLKSRYCSLKVTKL